MNACEGNMTKRFKLYDFDALIWREVIVHEEVKWSGGFVGLRFREECSTNAKEARNLCSIA